MEDYKEKYEEVLKRAKSAIKECGDNKGRITMIESIFPELAQSEDENSKKWILEYLYDGLRKSDEQFKDHFKAAIAWLEKRGDEQNLTLPKWKYKKDNAPLLRDSLILNKYGCVAKSPSGAIVSDVWVIDYDELAKLPKEKSDKQGEQKSADKVEPKFKVGDWIISSEGKLRHIVDVDKTGYQTDNGWLSHEHYEKRFHLWTIQDAKDGDLLADNYGIYIFDRFDEYDEKCFICMGAYQHSQKVYENEHMLCSVEVHPATQEQRNLLFQKMKEAGYEWSDKDRKLIKIVK